MQIAHPVVNFRCSGEILVNQPRTKKVNRSRFIYTHDRERERGEQIISLCVYVC